MPKPSDRDAGKERKQPSGAFPWILLGAGAGALALLIAGAAAVIVIVVIFKSRPGNGEQDNDDGPDAVLAVPAPKFPDRLILPAATQFPLRDSHEAIISLHFAGPETHQVLVQSAKQVEFPKPVGKETRYDRYDLKTGKRLSTLFQNFNPSLGDISLSPDGTCLAIVTINAPEPDHVSLWLLSPNREIVAKFTPEVAAPRKDAQGLVRIALLDNDRLLVVEGNGTRSLWSLSERRRSYRVEAQLDGGPDVNLKVVYAGYGPKNFVVSGDRKLLAIQRGPGFDVIDTETGQAIKRLDTLEPIGSLGVFGVGFRANNQELIASCHGETFKKSLLARWDVQTGAVKSHIELKHQHVHRPQAWGDNHLLLWGPKGAVLVDLKQSEYVRQLKFAPPGFGPDSCATVSSDGRLWFPSTHQDKGAARFLTAIDAPAEKDFQAATPVNAITKLAEWHLTPDGIETQARQ
jgi:hypothetical protein